MRHDEPSMGGTAPTLQHPNIPTLPSRVRIVEVGPRDGLQNESVILSPEQRAQYIGMLTDAGFSDIEVGSFVSPKRVPQLADTESVFARIPARKGLTYWALVPNEKALERALASGCRAIAFFTAASETFNGRNIGMSVTESLGTYRGLLPRVRESDLRVRAYVSTAFVCPYEGRIPPERVVPVVAELVEMGVDEVSLGDTIGHAVPTQVGDLAEALIHVLPIEKTAYHFHDTRGAALANVLMALQTGASAFDSSAGGLGGCPFAPGAAGNLATEDLLVFLHAMGIETGIDLHKVIAASRYLESLLGHRLPSRVLRASLTEPCERLSV